MTEYDKPQKPPAWLWPVTITIIIIWILVWLVAPIDSIWLSRIAMIVGLILGSLILLINSRSQLSELEKRWIPGSKNIALDLRQDKAQQGASAKKKRASVTSTDRLQLGKGANPAFAKWSLKWEWSDGSYGKIPLPLGESVLLGRSEKCDILVYHDEINEYHLRFNVSPQQVTLKDIGYHGESMHRTSNTSWGLLPKDLVVVFERGASLRLGNGDVTLTLEPI